MIISSMVVKCIPGHEKTITTQLRKFSQITIAAVLKGQIVLVMENESWEEACRIVEKGIDGIAGVLGIYPAYIYFEDEFSA